MLSAELQAATGRTYEVTRVAIRTLWFDAQLLAALDPARQPQPLLAVWTHDMSTAGAAHALLSLKTYVHRVAHQHTDASSFPLSTRSRLRCI